MSSRIEDKNWVPYIIFESAQTRMERTNKRLWIAMLFLIVLLFISNGAWLFYEKQFDTVTETTTVTQESDSGVNNFIGDDGEIVNGEADGNEN